MGNTTTTVTCPACGQLVILPLVMTNATLGGNETNIAVTCAYCDATFDAAPLDGAYSTIGGRLALIRAGVTATRLILDAAPSREELRRLADTVRVGQLDQLDTEQIIRQISGFEAFKAWANANQALANALFSALIALLTLLGSAALQSGAGSDTTVINNTEVVVEMPSDQEIERMLERLVP